MIRALPLPRGLRLIILGPINQMAAMSSETQKTNMIKNPSNWAGNYTYRAVRLHRPETIAQIQELVSRSPKVKALGSRHSFNDIADSPEDLVSLEHFDQVLELDRERRTVTVEAGIRYGQLCYWLHHEFLR